MMEETFQLSISLGNDAMLVGQDIADALRGVADRVQNLGQATHASGFVHDVNGNTVGSWSVR